jgi:hypothetical protein
METGLSARKSAALGALISAGCVGAFILMWEADHGLIPMKLVFDVYPVWPVVIGVGLGISKDLPSGLVAHAYIPVVICMCSAQGAVYALVIRSIIVKRSGASLMVGGLVVLGHLLLLFMLKVAGLHS